MATAGSPSSRALSRPGASATLLSTRTISAGTLPRWIANWIARKLLPRPESRTARRGILAISDIGFWILDSGSNTGGGLLGGFGTQFIEYSRAARLEGADQVALLRHGAQQAQDLGQAGGVHRQDHADAHVEDAEHLLGLDLSRLLEIVEEAGHRPAPDADQRVGLRRHDARQVVRDAAARDVGHAVQRGVAEQGPQRLEIGEMGLEELLAHGPLPVPGRLVADAEAGLLEDDLAGEGVAVG